MKSITILCFALVLTTLHTAAQDIANTNLSWSFTVVEEIGNGILDDRGGTIRSYGKDRVEWYDDEGTLVLTFPIQGAQGNWTNVQREGRILYTTQYEEKSTSVIFERDSQCTRVTIGIMQDDGFPLIREFKIQNVNTL